MTKLAYSLVTDPRFANAGQTMIDCLVVFPELGRAPLPFTAAQVDPGAEHSEEIFRRCLAGEFGPVAPFEEVQPIAGGFDVEATGADDGDFAERPSRMPKLEPLPIARRTSGHKPAKRKPAPSAAPLARRDAKPPASTKKRKPPATKPPKRKR